MKLPPSLIGVLYIAIILSTSESPVCEEFTFTLLAEFSKNSLVIGPNINKKINSEISIKRNDIPWDQALDEVTEFLNLKAKITNGVIYIEEKKNKSRRKAQYKRPKMK